MRASIIALLGLGFVSSSAWAVTDLYVEQFMCENAEAHAAWDPNQDTDLESDSRLLSVRVRYMWIENEPLNTYRYKFQFYYNADLSCESTINTSGHTGGDGYLSLLLDTGGDRYYKSYNLKLYSEVKSSGGTLLDGNQDSMSFTVYDTSWTIPTQTEITNPKKAKYKFDNIYVSGWVKGKKEDGSQWVWVEDGCYVDLLLENGFDQMSAEVTTSGGQFNHTFQRPTGGWDPNDDYKVTATFEAGQIGPEPYQLAYQSSSDSEQHAINSTVEMGKSMGWAMLEKTAQVTTQNPTDDRLPDGATLVFDLDGSQVGSHITVAPLPHGAEVIDEDTLDEDLNTDHGTITIEGLIPGYETWAQPGWRANTASPLSGRPAPETWVETLAFVPPVTSPSPPLAAGAWSHSLAFDFDPPVSSATLTLRFYDAMGGLLRTEYATLASHERFEIPPTWLTGAASVHAAISEGTLVGWATAEDAGVDAFEILAHTSPSLKLSAPFMPASGWNSSMTLHNPSSDPATIEIRLYDLAGTPLYVEQTTIPPRGTITREANYVAPGIDKTVEVIVNSGEGIVGTCVRATDEAVTMAEPLVTAAAALRVPSPGSPDLDDGLLALHNPDDTAVEVRSLFYGLDGTLLDDRPDLIPPHATILGPIISAAPGVEPLASIEIQTVGQGRVSAVAMFHQTASGGACSVPALSMPEWARCEPPWLREGPNLISLPLDPLDPNVASVLFALEQAGNVLSGAVCGYDGTAYQTYPDPLADLVRGEGYWLQLDSAVPFSVMGSTASQDVTIGLRNGWNLIGHPLAEARTWADCLVTNGVQTKSVSQAADAGWIQPAICYFDSPASYKLVNPHGTGDDDAVRPWYGYWLRTFQDGLHLVVPWEVGGGMSSGAAADAASIARLTLSADDCADWQFVAAIDATCSDDHDQQDVSAPPDPPAGQTEVRLTTSLDLYGPQMHDYRAIPAPGHTQLWNTTVHPVNFQPAQCRQVTMTWDLTQAGAYAYCLTDPDGGQTIDLAPGGQHTFQLCDQQAIPFDLRAREGGFLSADFDSDGDVDVADGDFFFQQFCGVGVAPADPRADLDTDGDCDLDDFAVFMGTFTGPY